MQSYSSLGLHVIQLKQYYSVSVHRLSFV